MRILLRGDEGDLGALSEALGPGRWALTRENDGRWFLDSAETAAAASTAEAADAAVAWLDDVKLATAVVSGRRPDVHFAHVIERRPDGSERLVNHARANLVLDAVQCNARGSVRNPSDADPPPPPRHVTHQERAHELALDPRLRDALRFYEQRDWAGLYKAYECVQSDHDVAVKSGWCTKAAVSAFCVSANSPEVSGTLARHAKSVAGAKTTPKRTMTLGEAQEFVRVLLARWLDARALERRSS